MPVSAERRFQRAQMRGRRFRQRGQVVAAFQQRDDPPFRVAPGDSGQLGRDPGEVPGVEFQLRQRIVAVGIEAGGDDQQLGAKLSSAGSSTRCQARRNASPPDPGGSGALTTLPATPCSLAAPLPG